MQAALLRSVQGWAGIALVTACAGATTSLPQKPRTFGMLDAQSSPSAKWLPELLVTETALHLALNQQTATVGATVGAPATRGLQVINVAILPPGLLLEPAQWELLVLKVDAANQLQLSLRYCPNAALPKHCQQRDFSFDLGSKGFALALFRSATMRSGETSSLLVDYKKRTAHSCAGKQAEPQKCYAETLLSDVPVPTFTTMPEAFAFAPSLELQIQYRQPKNEDSKTKQP